MNTGSEENSRRNTPAGNYARRVIAATARMQERVVQAAPRDSQAAYQARKKEYRVRMARQYFLAKTAAPVKERAASMQQSVDLVKKQRNILRSAAFWSSSIVLASAISYGVILVLKWISTLIHTVR